MDDDDDGTTKAFNSNNEEKQFQTKNTTFNRMGHTMSMIGHNIFVFGGIREDNSSSSPDDGPTNDLLVLRLRSSGKYKWINHHHPSNGSKDDNASNINDITEENWPSPRWRHSANIISATEFLIFGGFVDRNDRFNDVWVYNAVTLSFQKPVKISTRPIEGGNHIPPPNNNDKTLQVPSPRSGHASAVIGKTNQLFVFGGYGGWNYNVDYLNDSYILDTKTWTWLSLQTTTTTTTTVVGKCPEPRSGHRACTISTDTSSKIFISGGSNETQQFSDIFIFEISLVVEQDNDDNDTSNVVCSEKLVEKYSWTKMESLHDFLPRSFHAVATVTSTFDDDGMFVVFGGNGQSVLPDDDDSFIFQTRLNHMVLIKPMTSTSIVVPMDAHHHHHHHNIEPRSDMDIIYHEKENKLIIFGGWSNNLQILNDICIIDLTPILNDK